MENITASRRRKRTHEPPNSLLSSDDPCRSTSGPCLKKRKIREARKVVIKSESNEDQISSKKVDHVPGIPKQKKRRKNLAAKHSDIVDEGSEFTSKSSKKVSFSDLIDSRLISEKDLKLIIKNESNEPPPKSILKHTNAHEDLKLCIKNESNESCPKSILRHTKKHKKLKKTKVLTPGSAKQNRASVYLETWKNRNSSWKFEKVIQTWLLKNMFDETKVPKKMFALLLEYIKDMRGAAVSMAKQSCTNIISRSETSVHKTEQNGQFEFQCHRASLVLQCLTK